MNIIIKKHLLLYKGYKLKCSIGKSGITTSKKEGDLASPKGIFKLGLLYYRKDRIKLLKCKIRKKIIKKNMGWCNDSRSNKYKFKKTCPLSTKGAPSVDYKNVRLLKKYMSENGKILPSRITNVSQKKQRELSLSIKRARNLALI